MDWQFWRRRRRVMGVRDMPGYDAAWREEELDKPHVRRGNPGALRCRHCSKPKKITRGWLHCPVCDIGDTPKAET